MKLQNYTLLYPGYMYISIDWSAFNCDGTNYLAPRQIATHRPPQCHTRLINTYMSPGGIIPTSKLPLAFEQKRIRRRKTFSGRLKALGARGCLWHVNELAIRGIFVRLASPFIYYPVCSNSPHVINQSNLSPRHLQWWFLSDVYRKSDILNPGNR